MWWMRETDVDFCPRGSYPDLHMSPFAEPLLSRFWGGEFSHLFSIQLQDTRVFMPHDLQDTFQWPILSISVRGPAGHLLTGHKKRPVCGCWLTCLRRKDTTSVDSQYDAWKRWGKATVGKAVRASGQYRAKSSRFVPHQRAATAMGTEWIGCRHVRWNCRIQWELCDATQKVPQPWSKSKKIILIMNRNHHRSQQLFSWKEVVLLTG